MPIEIREIVVRTVVGGEAPSAPPDPGGPGRPDLPGGLSFEQLVQECVRQVMLALARERER